MTNSNQKFVLAYILLVALPLFGLAGILHSGRKLSAPMSVDGSWKISVNPDQLAGISCGKLLLSQNAGFTISQSGRAFTLNFRNAAWSATSGAVDGDTINSTLTPSVLAAKEAGCGERSLSLTATVDAKASPRTLQGTLRVQNCVECAAIEFRGIREEQAKAKETH